MSHRIPSLCRVKTLPVVFLILFLLLLQTPTLSAWEEGKWDPAAIYSLADLLRIALLHDPGILLAGIQVDEAMAMLSSLQGTLHPQLILSGEHRIENVANHPMAQQLMGFYDLLEGFGEMIEEGLGEWLDIEDPQFELDGIEPHHQVETTIGSITLAQQLGAHAPLRNALEKAAIGKEMSLLQQEQTLSQLALQVQHSYHSLIKAYYNLQLLQQLVEKAAEDVQRIQHKQSIGTATLLDVLQEKNRELEAENQFRAAQMGLEMAVLQLIQTIGLDPSTSPPAQAFADQLLAQEKRAVEKWELDFEKAVGFALENRPEGIMAQKQLDITALDYQDHKQKRDWTLQLTGQYMVDQYILDGSLDSNRLFRGTVAGSEIKWPDSMGDFMNNSGEETNPWQVGVQVNYTFGQGRRKEAEAERLRLASQGAQIQRSAAQDGIYLEVYLLYHQLEQTWRSYELAKKGLQEAEETYKNLVRMQQLGSVTQKEIQEGELYVTQAQNHVLSTGLDYQAQKGELARALGIDSTTLFRAITGSIPWSCVSVKEENAW